MFKDCTFNVNVNLPENREEENTQHFLYDEYDDYGRNEIESLINKLNLVEGMDYYWGKNETQDVWELWVLPEQFGSIYHKIHETKVDVNKVNIDLNNPTDQVHCTRKLYSFDFPFSKVELGERLYDFLMCYKIVQLNFKGDIVDVYVGR